MREMRAIDDLGGAAFAVSRLGYRQEEVRRATTPIAYTVPSTCSAVPRCSGSKVSEKKGMMPTTNPPAGMTCEEAMFDDATGRVPNSSPVM